MTEPGWFPHVETDQVVRYWDGVAWTAERAWNGTEWVDQPLGSHRTMIAGPAAVAPVVDEHSTVHAPLPPPPDVVVEPAVVLPPPPDVVVEPAVVLPPPPDVVVEPAVVLPPPPDVVVEPAVVLPPPPVVPTPGPAPEPVDTRRGCRCHAPATARRRDRRPAARAPVEPAVAPRTGARHFGGSRRRRRARSSPTRSVETMARAPGRPRPTRPRTSRSRPGRPPRPPRPPRRRRTSTTSPVVVPAVTPGTVPVFGTVARTCGATGRGDCFVSVRTAPNGTSPEVRRILEGQGLAATCQVAGESVSSSVIGRSSAWTRLTDGTYVASVYVNAPGFDPLSVSVPCP